MLYQTHVRVHLENIRKNIHGIRQRIGPDRKILLAVKANAYGHGAIEVSRLAESSGGDWLGVATVPEGIALREAGIRLPILKFTPCFREEMEAAIRHSITLPICTEAHASDLESHGVRQSVHVKVDTGMGRLGVAPDRAVGLCEHIIRRCPHLHVEGVFTHFPVSGAPAGRAFTENQIGLFERTVRAMEAGLGYKIAIVHAANSGAILAQDNAFFDMVRPGIMLYGYRPDENTPATIPLYPGISFYTRVAFIKRVAAGTPIGYGGTWVAPSDVTIATLPVGYADGFNRLFSNAGRVLIRGRSFPVIGRVCMDQTMVNLGDDAEIEVGDQVTLIGRDGQEEITTEEWARKLGTITYEVTCQINSRVTRVYDEVTVSGGARADRS